MTVGTGRTPMLDVHSPADGRVVGRVEDLAPEAGVALLEALRREQPAWEALPVSARVSWLHRYRDWLLDNEHRLNQLLQQETGKPWGQTTMELSYVVHHLNYYAGLAPRTLKATKVARHSVLVAGKRQDLRYRPYPVVGVVTPWNFPLALSLIDSVPALLAGAAVAVKPSEATPLAVRAAVEGWTEIGAPAVFTVLTGGRATGATVVDNVDFVQFTGSTRTGRAVAVRCAERLIPCGLELGGKDPMVVLAGADLARAANAAVWGALANSGQMCTSVERVYVEEPAFDGFVTEVLGAVARLRVGHDDDRSRYDIGPLATAAQVDIVRSHLEDAVARGARVLTGGTIDDNLVAPTVLVDVDHTMTCLREETFGPLLPIMRVADADEAVSLANDSPYGLSAHVFGPDGAATLSVARRIDVGSVNVNDVAANLSALALPQGGWGQSGLGARNGAERGLLKYCRPQAFVTSRLSPRREPTWFPYSWGRSTTLSRALRLFNARDVRRRLGLTGAATSTVDR